MRNRVVALAQLPLPSGVVTSHYLAPRLNPQLALHRRLIVNGRSNVPRPTWWVAQTLATARWVTYGANSIYNSEWVSACMVRVAANEAVSVDEQRRRIKPLIRRGILPHDIFELGLYRSDSLPWERYIYNRESAAFNELRSCSLGSRADFRYQRDQLSDKEVTRTILTASAIPTVPTLAMLCDGDPIPHGDAPIFVKPRIGFGGQGAFASLPTHDYEIARIRDWRHTSSRPVDGANERVARGPVLVQPLLRAHPIFDTLSLGVALDVPTLRIVTASPLSAEPPVWHAFLELPRSSYTDDRVTYYALSINEHGLITQLHIPPWLDHSTYLRDPRVLDVIGTTAHGWHEAREHVVRAHTNFPNVYSIAWDVALTEDGPIVLEGNTAFSIVRHQVFSGPLLTD